MNLFKFLLLKKNINIFLYLIFIIYLPNLSFADIKYIELEKKNINPIIETEIKEKFSYSGLASYYNSLTAYIVDSLGIKKIEKNNLYNLNPQQSLVIIGHYKVMIIKNLNTSLSFNQKIIWNQKNYDLNENKLKIKIFLKSELKNSSELYKKLRYIHLWLPLQKLCHVIETILIWLYSIHNFG